MKILMTISPSSKLTDIEALLDSYAVVLSRDTKALQSGPLSQLEMTGGIGARAEPVRAMTAEDLNSEIDPALDLCIIQCAPLAEENRESKARWPFFVESELHVVFSVGDQWWQYDFSPGKTYTDRTAPARPQTGAPE
jgi:hypothetical protein